MRKRLAGFLRDESGATAIEYGLMTAMIAVGAIFAFGVLGGGLQTLFGSSQSGVGGAMSDAVDKLGTP